LTSRPPFSLAPPSTRSRDPFPGFGSIEVRRQRAIADQTLHEQIGFRGAGIDADSTVGQLSGGERQGIAIGGAMHFDADLIILDEPTVALAIKEVQRIPASCAGSRNRAAPAFTSSTISRTFTSWLTGSWCSTAARLAA
jgi:ABC-type sugar transport system ATPase subunit